MFSGNCDSTKCTIVTSLSAVINDSLSRSLRSQLCSISKECIAGTIKTPALSKEMFYDHPVIRRSKKHTRLNGVNISEFTLSRRAEINRIVLLPYLGCTRRFETVRSYDAHVLAKSSKSWETVGKSNKAKNVKPFRSQIFNSEGSINNTLNELNFLDYQNLVTNERSVRSLREYELPNTGFNISEGAVRSFYLIKTPISGAKKISGCQNTVEKACNVRKDKLNSENTAVSFLEKNDLHKCIPGFEENVSAPSAKLGLKKTRNVSILHRPKTLDKSTSTTFLDESDIAQDLDKSIQGLLLPYIANGRDFPSEIVLKLVPKTEALKNALNENTSQANRSNSSEANLLAPILNTTEIKPKKKSGKKSFWNCFSKKKNTDDDTSDDTSSKEVYFPSIVEVHNKNKKFDDHNLETDNSVCSFYNVEKPNTRL